MLETLYIMTRNFKQHKKSVQDAQKFFEVIETVICADCTKKEDLYEEEMAYNAPCCFYGSIHGNGCFR